MKDMDLCERCGWRLVEQDVRTGTLSRYCADCRSKSDAPLSDAERAELEIIRNSVDRALRA